MPSNSGGTIITTRGLQLITKLAAAKDQMQFTNVKVGTGNPPEGTDPSGLTHLAAYKMDGMIAEYGYDEEEHSAYVVMQLTNTSVEVGFVMTEIGLYAMDPDLGEILYAYVDLSDDPNYIMPAENGRSKTVQIKLHVFVGEVTQIVATINPLAQVTRAEFDLELGKKVNSDGGDIADTKVSSFAANSTQWPVPAAGESPKTLWGKVKKFTEDFKNWMSGVCLIGQIVNNCVTNNPNLPLSAAQGKALMDLYTVLNTKLSEKYGIQRRLTQEDNLNNVVEKGIYWYITGEVPLNAPFQNASLVEVIGSTSDVTQTIQRVTRYGLPGHCAFRPLLGSEGWLNWAYVVTQNTPVS